MHHCDPSLAQQQMLQEDTVDAHKFWHLNIPNPIKYPILLYLDTMVIFQKLSFDNMYTNNFDIYCESFALPTERQMVDSNWRASLKLSSGTFSFFLLKSFFVDFGYTVVELLLALKQQ